MFKGITHARKKTTVRVFGSLERSDQNDTGQGLSHSNANEADLRLTDNYL